MYRLILSEHDVIIVVTAEQQERCQSIQWIDYVKKNDPILLNINKFWNLGYLARSENQWEEINMGTTNLKATNIFVGLSFLDHLPIS